MAKQSNSILVTAIFVSCVFLCLFLGVFFLVNFFSNRSLVDPLQLNRENEIRNISTKLLLDATSDSKTSSESLKTLEKLMIKLRDGWPGIVRDNYYPHDFDSHDLLGSIYWDVAKTAPACKSASDKKKLLHLLTTTAPTSNSKLFRSYDYAITENGLRELKRNDPKESRTSEGGTE